MKLPRGVSADRLIRVLELLGYTIVRQKGRHVRLRHAGLPAHHLTMPMHRPLKLGTLHAILAEVAQARSLDVESIGEML